MLIDISMIEKITVICHTLQNQCTITFPGRKTHRKNIPYRIYGGINFYARREIKDILAYLKTIDNARDDLAVKRILNVPKRGIGAASVAKVDDYAYENDITFMLL